MSDKLSIEIPRDEKSLVGFTDFSLYWFYFYYGFNCGHWVSKIPIIEENLNISDVVFGLLLVGGGLGAMLAIPIVARLINTIGSARTLLSGSVAMSFIFPLCGINSLGIWPLAVGLFGIGMSSACIDVSNSTQAVTIELVYSKNIIGILQAINSLGNLSGVIIGGLCALYGIPANISFLCIGLLGASTSYFFFHFLIDFETERSYMKLKNQESSSAKLSSAKLASPSSLNYVSIEPLSDDEVYEAEKFTEDFEFYEVLHYSSSFIRFDEVYFDIEGPVIFNSTELSSIEDEDDYFNRDNNSNSSNNSNDSTSSCCVDQKLLGLCCMGFINLLSVGSVNNWSTIYFSDTLMTSPFFTSTGYAAFQLFVMIGQISNDSIVRKFGSKKIVVYSGLIAAFGAYVVVFAPSLVNMIAGPSVSCYESSLCTSFGILGYAITGVGLSSIGPVLISQTGKLKVKNMTSAGQIAALTLSSYIGILVGPLIFGGLSVIFGQLRWALLFAASLILFISPLALFTFYD